MVKGQSRPSAGGKRYGHLLRFQKPMREFWGLDQLSKICLHHLLRRLRKKSFANPKFLFYLLTEDFTNNLQVAINLLEQLRKIASVVNSITAIPVYSEVTVKIPITVHQDWH